MGCIPWSQELAIGCDEIDACHRALMDGISDIYGAVRRRDLARAAQLAEELYDLSAIHSQAEDEVLDSRNHPVPHEIIDDFILRIRSSLKNETATIALISLIENLQNIVLCDILSGRPQLRIS